MGSISYRYRLISSAPVVLVDSRGVESLKNLERVWLTFSPCVLGLPRTLGCSVLAEGLHTMPHVNASSPVLRRHLERLAPMLAAICHRVPSTGTQCVGTSHEL